jgi:hypothetical protein
LLWRQREGAAGRIVQESRTVRGDGSAHTPPARAAKSAAFSMVGICSPATTRREMVSFQNVMLFMSATMKAYMIRVWTTTDENDLLNAH